jgi:transcriptional regulator GlxA family with amidase domain
MTREVAIIVLDGYADSALAVLHDVLRASCSIAALANKPAPFRVTLVSPTPSMVRSATGGIPHGVRSLRALDGADLVVVPGIWLDDPRHLDRILARPDIATTANALARAHARGAIVAASCMSVFILARAKLGLHRATTTWWLANELRERHPELDISIDDALVVDARILTAGAVFATADLALYLVSRFGGPALARETARVLLLDRHTSQARYMAKHHLRTNDAIVRRAESWARVHLADSFDIAALAKHAHTTPRTLARRLSSALGLSPIAFVQQLRLEHALNLLETSSLSMDEIATRVGYSDANTLGRLIRRETRSTPRELRKRIA